MTIDECARIEELISAQQDGAATPEERATIERHVAGCARCQATVAAFGQVDRQVRRYLMATPVPEIAAPWRNEPIPLPVRRGGGLGHWRVTAVGLAAIFVMLFTASIVAFQPFAPAQSQTAGSRPASESAPGGAPAAAQIVATPTPAAAFAAPAASAQPTTAAAARGAAGSAAPSTAPRTSAASSAPSSAPAATPGSAAAIAGPPTGTPAPAPMAGAAVDSANPAQLYRLREATTLLICQADCAVQPQPAAVLTAVATALERPLTPLPPAAAASTPGPYLTLRFVQADGRATDIGYYPQAQRLQLPDGRGLVTAPQEVIDALAPVLPR